MANKGSLLRPARPLEVPEGELGRGAEGEAVYLASQGCAREVEWWASSPRRGRQADRSLLTLAAKGTDP